MHLESYVSYIARGSLVHLYLCQNVVSICRIQVGLIGYEFAHGKLGGEIIILRQNRELLVYFVIATLKGSHSPSKHNTSISGPPHQTSPPHG